MSSESGQDLPRRLLDDVCTECGGFIVHVSGCETCVTCGHSRCGG